MGNCCKKKKKPPPSSKSAKSPPITNTKAPQPLSKQKTPAKAIPKTPQSSKSSPPKSLPEYDPEPTQYSQSCPRDEQDITQIPVETALQEIEKLPEPVATPKKRKGKKGAGKGSLASVGPFSRSEPKSKRDSTQRSKADYTQKELLRQEFEEAEQDKTQMTQTTKADKTQKSELTESSEESSTMTETETSTNTESTSETEKSETEKSGTEISGTEVSGTETSAATQKSAATQRSEYNGTHSTESKTAQKFSEIGKKQEPIAKEQLKGRVPSTQETEKRTK